MNTLYYGDNLEILQNREYFPDKCVDLIYLDPPFNSNRNYNVLFKDESGEEAQAQIRAFEDTWHWDYAAGETYRALVREGDDVARMIESFRSFIGDNQMMAYLVMMAARLKELHRVLKQTGSLYLHCDPTASHYLKILLDSIFSFENFRSEIIWRRTNAHNKLTKQFGPIHDTIFFYTKSDEFKFSPGRRPYTKGYVKNSFPYEDARGRYQSNVLTGSGTRTGDSGKPWRQYNPTPKGRHWAISSKLIDDLSESVAGLSTQEILDLLDAEGLILHPVNQGSLPRYKQYLDTSEGVLHQDIWAYQPGTEGLLVGSDEGIDGDVKWLDADTEKLGYPTQKPVALLERIISASSNEGDVVLDPFCGCGTTIAAAQKLNRQWIGIDVTRLAITLQKYRLRTSFGLVPIGTKSSPPYEGGVAVPTSSVGTDGVVLSDAVKDIPKNDLDAAPENHPTAKAAPLLRKEGSKMYRVIGEPKDLHDAHKLVEVENERYQFQWWALGLIKARPLGAQAGSKQGKKGSDKGIDGIIPILDDPSGKTKRILVQVKSGKVKSGDIRDLIGTVESQNAAMGVFITLQEPSPDMRAAAASADVYHSEHFNRDYPKIQILTIADLFEGKEVKMPGEAVAFKKGELQTPTTPDVPLPFE